MVSQNRKDEQLLKRRNMPVVDDEDDDVNTLMLPLGQSSNIQQSLTVLVQVMSQYQLLLLCTHACLSSYQRQL